MATKSDKILSALESIIASQTDLAKRVGALETTKNAPEKQPAPATPKSSPVTVKSPNGDVRIITGLVTYVSLQGYGAQIDGPEIGKRSDGQWYNGAKNTTPFAGLLGKRAQITYHVLPSDNGVIRNRVLNVETVKSAATKPADTTNISGLAVRANNPTTASPDGCSRCGGPKHGKNAQGTIIDECLIQQFVKATGESYRPHSAVSRMAVASWLDSHEITVAVVYDGSKAARIGGKNELSATATRATVVNASKGQDSSEAPVKRGPGRPRKNPEAAPITPIAPVAPKASKASSVQMSGKLLKISSNSGKVQFQPTGEKFQWIMPAAGVKVNPKWIGKSVLATVTTNGLDKSISEMSRAPKA